MMSVGGGLNLPVCFFYCQIICNVLAAYSVFVCVRGREPSEKAVRVAKTVTADMLIRILHVTFAG